MLSIPRPVFVPGIWGPYASVLLPDHWVLEAGQSATGKLLDHIIETHPSHRSLAGRLNDSKSIPEELHDILKRLAEKKHFASINQLTKDIHLWPDFHGNRSPLADPNLKGMV